MRKMDAVRDQVAALEARERDLLEERAADSRDSYVKAVVTDLLAVALSSVIVGAAYVLTRRELVARAEAEAALRQSQERLRLAQRAGQLGAFEWDLRSGQSVGTAELEALYGLAPGGLGEGRDAWRQRLHPDDVAAAERAHAVAAANGGEFDTEFR